MSITLRLYSISFTLPLLNELSQCIMRSFVRSGFFISSRAIFPSKSFFSASSSSIRSLVVGVIIPCSMAFMRFFIFFLMSFSSF